MLGALLLLAGSLAAAPAPAPEPPSFQKELANVVDLFYGFDFDRAATAAAALEKEHPGHPAGPFFGAAVVYQRWVADGLPEEGWAGVDRALARADAAAKAVEKASPAESHYYRGAALGFRARGLAARRRFVRALPDAASSLSHLKKALALDPRLMDAKLGLGMYHYFAARMPAGAKPFARLLVGEPGNREQGLGELWQVAYSSGAARMEARAVLSMILSKDDEKQWDRADQLLVELVARYPRNPLYRLRRAYVAERQGRLARAAALADPDGGWLEAMHPSIRARARAQALYRAAETALLLGRTDEAARRLDVLDDAVLPKPLRDWARVRRANLRDARGERGAARAEYARVSDKRAKEAAKGFLAAPFPGGPRDVAPFFAGY